MTDFVNSKRLRQKMKLKPAMVMAAILFFFSSKKLSIHWDHKNLWNSQKLKKSFYQYIFVGIEKLFFIEKYFLPIFSEFRDSCHRSSLCRKAKGFYTLSWSVTRVTKLQVALKPRYYQFMTCLQFICSPLPIA